MIVAPIPVHGRGPLLKITIQRLYRCGADRVICIGDDPELKEMSEDLGAEWVEHDNHFLSNKWNAGFLASKKYAPAGVLYVGSSDWIHDYYIEEARPFLKFHDLIGTLGCFFADVANDIRVVYWPGYRHGPRSDEPIGIGRLLSNRILDKINWMPFKENINSSLDWSMWIKCLEQKASVKIINRHYPMSISTDKWSNKHSFEDHWNQKLPSIIISDYTLLIDHFHEIYDLHSPKDILP